MTDLEIHKTFLNHFKIPFKEIEFKNYPYSDGSCYEISIDFEDCFSDNDVSSWMGSNISYYDINGELIKIF